VVDSKFQARRLTGGLKDAAKQFQRLLRLFVDKSSSIGVLIAGGCIFLILLLVLVDVLIRYFLNISIHVSYEISSYCLVGVTFLALGQIQKLDKHVKVEFLVSRLSLRYRTWLKIVAEILSLAFVSWFTWDAAMAVMRSYSLKSAYQSMLQTPLWIPHLLLPIGLGILALQMICQIVNQWSRAGRTEVFEA